MNVKLGFSTGVLYQSVSNETEHIRIIRDFGARFIELNFVKGLGETYGKITADDLVGFEYVSLHAPVITYGFNAETIQVFNRIALLHRIRPLDLVVFHPDTIKDVAAFNGLAFPFAFENMDKRKKSHKDVEDMAPLFLCYPKAKLVLDVNHIYTNDPTMERAAKFYSLLGEKIVQIHLSGYAGYHDPLFQTRQKLIIQSIQDPTVPIIIESQLRPEDLARERDFILETLASP